MKSGFASSLVLLVPTIALGQSTAVHVPPVLPRPVPLEINGLATPLLEQADPGADSRPQVEAAAAPMAGAAAVPAHTAETPLFSRRIGFDEFPEGTPISDQYRDRGIVFGGSGPVTTPDLASPSSPVLAGTPLFEGDISGRFVRPGTDDAAPVYYLAFDIGFFDAVDSVALEFFGPAGELIHSFRNIGTGFYHYAIRGGNIGIASWRIHAVNEEPAGIGIDNVYFSIPGSEDPGREMGETECALGNPVNPAAGNKFQPETDYRGNRPFPLAVTRAYNSISGAWTFFPWLFHSPGSPEARLTRPDGKILTFTGGQGRPDWRATSTDITGELSADLDGAGNITGWRFKTLDDQLEVYDISGRIVSITQRSGVAHHYSYAPSKITVQHSLGGGIDFDVDLAGRVTAFTDPAGQRYTYTRNGNGMLDSVSYPGGSRRSYYYEDAAYSDLLTGISDANGDRYASWDYDLARRAVLSEHSGGAERTQIDYSYLDGPGTSRVTATNALGKQTTYYYTNVNGVQRVFQVSGHPSANCVAANQQYRFDSRAFIARKTDWEGNITEYLRDGKGRETLRREALGTPQEREIRTQWHATMNLPVRVTEPGRETHYSYDRNGNLVEKRLTDTSATN